MSFASAPGSRSKVPDRGMSLARRLGWLDEDVQLAQKRFQETMRPTGGDGVGDRGGEADDPQLQELLEKLEAAVQDEQRMMRSVEEKVQGIEEGLVAERAERKNSLQKVNAKLQERMNGLSERVESTMASETSILKKRTDEVDSALQRLRDRVEEHLVSSVTGMEKAVLDGTETDTTSLGTGTHLESVSEAGDPTSSFSLRSVAAPTFAATAAARIGDNGNAMGMPGAMQKPASRLQSASLSPSFPIARRCSTGHESLLTNLASMDSPQHATRGVPTPTRRASSVQPPASVARGDDADDADGGVTHLLQKLWEENQQLIQKGRKLMQMKSDREKLHHKSRDSQGQSLQSLGRSQRTSQPLTPYTEQASPRSFVDRQIDTRRLSTMTTASTPGKAHLNRFHEYTRHGQGVHYCASR